jgi:ABC-type transport system involved in multi-copper enzyme maturation permease subunit
LLGIAAWIGGELFAGITFGILYGAGMIFLGWPEEMAPGVTLLLYAVALAAAGGSFMLVRRILRGKPAAADPLHQPPPPPPQF